MSDEGRKRKVVWRRFSWDRRRLERSKRILKNNFAVTGDMGETGKSAYYALEKLLYELKRAKSGGD